MSAFERIDQEAARRAAVPNGQAPPLLERLLASVWADDVALVLDDQGLIVGYLPRTGLGVVYGESGSGKTFIVLDMSCHIAAGLPWRDRDVEQGVVIYVAAESPASVERRVVAWKRYHRVDQLPLLIVQSTVDLLNGDTDALVRLVIEVARTRGPVAAVIIDTLARAMTGNENAPDDMGRFVAACGRLREASGGLVLVVHHSGKDAARGARGHSSLRAATDVEIEIANGEAGGTIRVTKARDDAAAGAIGFRLEVVELGLNSRGRTVSTCVAVEANAPAAAAKARPLGANERIVLDALSAAIVDAPCPTPRRCEIPASAVGSSLEQWREHAMRYLPQAEPKRRSEAFSRASEKLVSGRLVHHVEGFVWLG